MCVCMRTEGFICPLCFRDMLDTKKTEDNEILKNPCGFCWSLLVMCLILKNPENHEFFRSPSVLGEGFIFLFSFEDVLVKETDRNSK